MHLRAKFDGNRTIDNEMATPFVKFKMSVADIVDFSWNFRF
jgi:hypothetical protein